MKFEQFRTIVLALAEMSERLSELERALEPFFGECSASFMDSAIESISSAVQSTITGKAVLELGGEYDSAVHWWINEAYPRQDRQAAGNEIATIEQLYAEICEMAKRCSNDN